MPIFSYLPGPVLPAAPLLLSSLHLECVVALRLLSRAPFEIVVRSRPLRPLLPLLLSTSSASHPALVALRLLPRAPFEIAVRILLRVPFEIVVRVRSLRPIFLSLAKYNMQTPVVYLAFTHSPFSFPSSDSSAFVSCSSLQ